MNNNTGSRSLLRCQGQIVLCTVILILASGCSKSTDPFGDGDLVPIAFSPKTQGQAITLAEVKEFSVSAPEANVLRVNWIRNGLVVSNEFDYTYTPSSLGADTLRVQADADGTNKIYFWVITVESEPSTSPPVVPGVSAEAGPAAGDVLVSWTKVSSSTFPLNEYVIVASFDGEITADNWSQARELRRVGHREAQVGYQENFTVAADGMREGVEIWVAVRAVDELEQMSPVSNNGFTLTTTAWWLNGVVEDEQGVRHAGIIVESQSPPLSSNTDLNGEFSLGPFRSIDQITLVTKSSTAPTTGWFDFRTAPLDSVTSDDLSLIVITRHEIDDQCTSFGGQFLTMLRDATRTKSQDPILRRWESLPLSYYLPDNTNSSGVDFADAARFAAAYWDSVLGGVYFVETTDQSSAELIFRFDNSATNLFGEVTLLQPFEIGLDVGEAVPQQMQVYINDAITTSRFAKEITLHEIGHVLGLFQHAACGDATFIMNVSPGGNLNQMQPIHRNEQQMVRTIFALPQNTDMSKYSLN